VIDPAQILKDPELHKGLHDCGARYHLAVLYFHLRKKEDPLCMVGLPGINPNVLVTQEHIDYVNSRLATLLEE